MLNIILLCLLSAILLILSFPQFNLWFFAWFGFVPLFFALRGKSKGRAFLLSYLTGIIFWSGTIYWLIHVTLPGTILLILYLALYFGFFGLIISPLTLNPSPLTLLFIPSLWVLLEYIRGYLFTGFPWALLGYSQYLDLPIIQIADITGVWGISFLVMMVNVTIWELLEGLRVKVKKAYLLPILCICVVLGYGYYKLKHSPLTTYPLPLRISVIQGNIPQDLKWDSRFSDFIIDKYSRLTLKAADDKPDLIIWPEAAVPVVLEEKSVFHNWLKGFTQKINTPLLFGAVTEKGSFYYNSALLSSSQGNILERYDKLHLVPFGEYIPLKKIAPFLETIVRIGGITSGKADTLFKLPVSAPRLPVNFSALICFEDLFPELSRRFVRNGAQLLVNITNDAWYKKTPAAYQHLQASVFRAVENRVPLARAANTGVSGFIASNGKIISLVKDKKGKNIFIDGYKKEEITLSAKPLTFYSRYGDIFVGLNLALILLCYIKLHY